MSPNYEAAAILAMETLVENKITSAPVSPLPIFKRTPGVLVLSFSEMAGMTEIDRSSLVDLFGPNQDAATVHLSGGKLHYVVAYNQRLPFYMLQRALARELGHILLGHDGQTQSAEERMAEAYCFAHHLLCPRPLVRALLDAGVNLTVETLGSATGCYGRFLAGVRKEPGVHVPPDLNRAVRDQLSGYMNNFVSFLPYLSSDDQSPPANFGSWMDGYEE